MFKRIKIGNRYLILGWQKCYTVKGVTSVCKDGKHIILWDFDQIDLIKDNLVQKLSNIQKQFSLSNIYIFKSSHNNYHAYCLKKFPFREMYKIICMTPDTDPNFLIWTARRFKTTLRTTPKEKNHPLKFLRFIRGYGKGEGSSAHRTFLTQLIPDAEKYFTLESLTWDDSYLLTAVKYDTGSIKI